MNSPTSPGGRVGETCVSSRAWRPSARRRPSVTSRTPPTAPAAGAASPSGRAARRSPNSRPRTTPSPPAPRPWRPSGRAASVRSSALATSADTGPGQGIDPASRARSRAGRDFTAGDRRASARAPDPRRVDLQAVEVAVSTGSRSPTDHLDKGGLVELVAPGPSRTRRSSVSNSPRRNSARTPRCRRLRRRPRPAGSPCPGRAPRRRGRGAPSSPPRDLPLRAQRQAVDAPVVEQPGRSRRARRRDRSRAAASARAS